MRLEWDEAKNRRNIAKHRIDFADAWRIFTSPMLARLDERRDYGEPRWIALGRLNDIVVVMVYTKRAERLRVISIRKGNKHESRIYQTQIASQQN